MLVHELCLSTKNESNADNALCIEYRRNLSQYVKDIIYNMSEKAAPTSFCGWCCEAVQKMGVILENPEYHNADGKSCFDLLANTEKGTIDSIDFIYKKWDSSFCSHCFERSTLDHNVDILTGSSHKVKLSKNSLNSFYNLQAYSKKVYTFFDKLDNVLTCFNQFINYPNISILNVLNFPSRKSLNISNMVCQNCSEVYHTLLDFYTSQLMRHNKMDGERGNLEIVSQIGYRFAVCLDVQDAINRTQWAWYNLLHCQTEEIQPIGFLLPLLICVVFLVIFHVLAQSVFRRPVHLMVYRPKRVEPTVRSQQRIFSASSITHEHMSLIRSYGSIGPVVENNSMERNSFRKNLSLSYSPPDGRIIVQHAARTQD
ncbi:unnamed protein product [Heterobilharzia americana]|nr:unnamed protein product [Heterobilharzia americana]